MRTPGGGRYGSFGRRSKYDRQLLHFTELRNRADQVTGRWLASEMVNRQTRPQWPGDTCSWQYKTASLVRWLWHASWLYDRRRYGLLSVKTHTVAGVSEQQGSGQHT